MTTDVAALKEVSQPEAPARASNRRADIQGLRAVAVLLVVAFHAKLPVPGGFVGVDVFFVISGFVITAMLMREWATAGRIRFRTFYFRRFLRLTPALALTVGVVALVSVVLQNPFGAQQTTARTGLGALLLSANFVIGHAAGDYFATDTTTNPLLNTWSLSVEEQFYLLFPALFVLGWTLSRRLGRRLGPPVVVVSIIGALSFVVAIAWSYGSTFASNLTDFFGGPESFAFYSPFSRAWEFAVGALLALLLAKLPSLSRNVTRATGIAGALLILVAAFAIHDSMPFPGLAALIPVAGTALLLLAGSSTPLGVNRALATRPMVAIGDASYSWYLWHWPIIVFAALLVPREPVVLVIAAVVSIVPALMSYWLVEQPIRRLRPRTRVRAAGVVIVTVGVPLALCGALLAGANAGWGLVPPAAATVPIAPPSPVVPVPSIASTLAPVPSVTESAPSAPDASPDVVSVPDPSAAATPDEQAAAAAEDTARQDGDVAGGDGGSLRSQHVAVRAGCVNTDLNPTACRFGPANAIGTVLLAGDSQAYAVADGTIAAAGALGYDTIVTSHTGCPFLARESSGTHNYPCRAWQKSIVAYALETRPAAVVISNRSAGYVHPEWNWRTAATDSGGEAGSVQEATALWRKGLEPIVSTLSKAGIPVVILGAVPEMTGYTNGTSLLGSAFGTPDFDIPRADSEADRKPAFGVETALAQAHPGTYVFDPYPALCDESTCSAVRDDVIRYQDETHLSVEGSMLLTDGLTETLRTALSETAAGVSASSTGSALPPQ